VSLPCYTSARFLEVGNWLVLLRKLWKVALGIELDCKVIETGADSYDAGYKLGHSKKLGGG